MNTDILLIYSLVSFFYIISPGPAIFLAITNGLTANMKTVMISSLGNILGLFVLSAISILGLGALLLSSAVLFMAVKIIGAAYLIYLGIKQLLRSTSAALSVSGGEPAKVRSLWAYFTESFLLAVTNPKPILFFVALFPQFLAIDQPIAAQFFILTSIFMVLSFLSLITYGYISKSTRRLFSSESVMSWFHRITGGLFIVMGCALLKLKQTQH